MNNSKESQSEIVHKESVVVMITILFIGGLSLSQIYGFTLLPDEFGYWAHGARLIGFDWSEVSALNPYYAFGYGFLLAPLLFLFQNMVWMYRIAIILQFAMVIGMFFLLRTIFFKLQRNKELVIIAVTVALFYPTTLIYAQMTMSETLLTLSFLLLVYFVSKYSRTASVINGSLCVVTAMWLYAVHMRSIAVVIAMLITLIAVPILRAINRKRADSRRKRKKHSNDLFKFIMIPLLIAVLIIIFIILTRIRVSYQNSLAEAGLGYDRNVNTYSGQIDRLLQVFTLNGFGTFLISLLGKWFYLGISTFGLIYWGIVYFIRRFRKKHDGLSLFLLLSLFGVTTMIAITSAGGYRADELLYGRYNEFVILPFVVAGIFEIRRTKQLIPGLIIQVLFHLIAFVAVSEHAAARNLIAVEHHSVIGVGYAFFMANEDTYKAFLYAYVIGNIILVLAELVMAVVRKRHQRWLYLILVPELIIAGIAYKNIVYPSNVIAKECVEDLAVLDDMDLSERRLVSYHMDEMGQQEDLQFYFLRKPVHVIKNDTAFEAAEIAPTDIIFFNPYDEIGWELQSKYDVVWLTRQYGIAYQERTQ